MIVAIFVKNILLHNQHLIKIYPNCQSGQNLFSCPILFAVLQMVLILIFFNYDSPNILKQNNDDLKLRELFAKIYTSSVIEDRIDEIQVVGTNTENLSPEDEKLDSYSSVFCSSYYGRASMVGCLMAVF